MVKTKTDAQDIPAADTAPEAAEVRVDTAPVMSVTCDHTGYAPGPAVMVRKGSTDYSYQEAAALVSHGLGRISKAERAKLVSARLLPPLEEPKE